MKVTKFLAGLNSRHLDGVPNDRLRHNRPRGLRRRIHLPEFASSQLSKIDSAFSLPVFLTRRSTIFLHCSSPAKVMARWYLTISPFTPSWKRPSSSKKYLITPVMPAPTFLSTVPRVTTTPPVACTHISDLQFPCTRHGLR